jgi:two-component system, cell cycle sensor histidine kinase and response regulator CckA
MGNGSAEEQPVEARIAELEAELTRLRQRYAALVEQSGRCRPGETRDPAGMSEAQHHATLDAMDDAIHVIDERLRIVFLNRSARDWCATLGVDSSTTGRDLFDMFPFLPERVRDEYLRVFATSAPIETEERTEIDGREYFSETRKIPVSENGKVVRVVTVIRDVTERKHMENALRESQKRYESVFANSLDGIFLTDPEGNCLAANPAGCQMLGRTEEELRAFGRTVVVDFTDPRFQNVLEKRTRTGRCKGEITYKHKDGSTIPVEISTALFRDCKGKDWAVVIARDISERQRAEWALKETNHTLEALIDASPLAIVFTDADLNVKLWNPMAVRLFGWSEEEILGRPVPMIPENKRGLVSSSMRQVLQGKSLTDWEARPVTKDGRRLSVVLSAAPVLDANGRPVGVMAMYADTTKRKAAEQALRGREELYRTLVEAIDDAIHVKDRDGRYVMVNSEFARRCQLAKEDILGKTPIEVHGQISGSISATGDVQVIRTGTVVDAVEEYPARERAKICHVRKVPLRSPEGDVTGLVAVSRDMTAHLRMDTALRESEERYRSFVKDFSGIAYQSRMDFIPIFVHGAVEAITGYSEADFLAGNPRWDQIIHPADLPALENSIAAIESQPDHSEEREYRIVRRDGEIRWVLEQIHNITDETGRPSFVRGTIRDVTQRKHLQEQLLRAQRLEAAGRTAGQVAHDFNNLLGPLVTYPDLIKMALPDDHQASMYCDTMQAAALQIADINAQMLALGRRGASRMEPTNLNGLVRQAVSQFRGTSVNSDIAAELAEELFSVMGSPAQLLRLVTNLLSNALDATAGRGKVVIKTENFYLDRPLNRYNRVEVGEYVKLSVIDDGCGIQPEIMDNIFDAFFTTKRADRKRGAGLGLSVVQAVADDHQGYVDVESAVGRRTSFYVYLPICRESAKEASREQPMQGRETILVVDDDPLQRQVTTRALGALGYRVDAVPSGEEAVAYLRERAADLLILDMIMPGGIDGAETYRQVQQIHPAQKVVIVSGFVETERMREAEKLGARSLLLKPVTLEKLTRAVREELKHQA